jgi:hypothetical protein
MHFIILFTLTCAYKSDYTLVLKFRLLKRVKSIFDKMDIRQFILRRNTNGRETVNMHRMAYMKGTICIKSNNSSGSVHTRFISSDDIIECTFKTCHDIPNYIDNRTRFLHGISVQQAFTYFAFVDDDQKIRKYKLADLKYDLNLGRIRIISS